ncbi:MAG: N-acetylmuramoyl-L-alanine amidase [Gammaproteobacteria bacterium]|nr:N-acetylmuramoyl-L-alanine amidase [Gammaproteobacteria bacterium]
MNTVQNYLPEHLWGEEITIEGGVIHYISAINTNPADPFDIDAIKQIFIDYGYGATELIDRDGTIIQLMPENRKAAHAGRSRMLGRDWCNGWTTGTEILSVHGKPYKGLPAYTDDQIEACIELYVDRCMRHNFSPRWIRGHDQVRKEWNQAHPKDKRARKRDPGKHFPWEYFKQQVNMRAEWI